MLDAGCRHCEDEGRSRMLDVVTARTKDEAGYWMLDVVTARTKDEAGYWMLDTGKKIMIAVAGNPKSKIQKPE